MTSLTTRQREVLRTIATFSAEHGYAPTTRELMALLDIHSENGVHDHLRRFRRQGLVTWELGKNRTLRLTAAGVRELGLREAA